MAKKEKITKKIKNEQDSSRITSFMKTYNLNSFDQVKVKAGEQIEKCKSFLNISKYESTINRDRRDYTKKLGYFNKIKDQASGKTIKSESYEENITYTGLKKLNELEIEEVEKDINKLYNRLIRKIKDAKISVNIKEHNTSGKRKEYSVHLRLEANRKIIATAKQADWDLPRALHKTIDNLENEAKHKLKFEGQNKRKDLR
ncbi:MAG: hypothetical protein Q8Q35_00330 [Nanoarchaeota archaeon]|nr:hypothetical protein [Nanoarchaeota archaeon]